MIKETWLHRTCEIRDNMKILVVDDERIVLDSCQRVLEADGFEVLLVTSVDKGIKVIEDENPALILIDVKMPERNGMDLLREVKEKWSDIPVVVMSGYCTTETIRKAGKMGAARFIAKPFTPNELLETIYQIIKKEQRYEKENPGD